MEFVNLETIIDMQSWCGTWPPNGSSRIRVKQKLLRPPRHIDDCHAIHFLNKEFCVLRFSSRPKFPGWARLYQHVFCKKPSLFLSSSGYRYLGPSESACRHYAHPNPLPLLLVTPLVIHEKNWQCLDIQGFPWL